MRVREIAGARLPAAGGVGCGKLGDGVRAGVDDGVCKGFCGAWCFGGCRFALGLFLEIEGGWGDVGEGADLVEEVGGGVGFVHAGVAHRDGGERALAEVGEEPGEQAIGGDEAFADEAAILVVFLHRAIDGAFVGEPEQGIGGEVQRGAPGEAEAFGVGAVAEIIDRPDTHPHKLGRLGDGPGGSQVAQEIPLLLSRPPRIGLVRADRIEFHETSPFQS